MNDDTPRQVAAVKKQYDDIQDDGRFEEGMARMAGYHRYCQDPMIFAALGDVSGLALLDLACGDGFYTRRFRRECGADPVLGIDLSPRQVERAREIERKDPLGIAYLACDVTEIELGHRFDVVTAIHLLHYLASRDAIAAALQRIFDALGPGGRFVTMIANPEFDLQQHDAADSKAKFGYYFSQAEPGNGGLFRFHPGGFEPERELTVEFHRWQRSFIDEIAAEVGYASKWHEPFISAEGLKTYGADYFDNYLPNPQSKLLVLTRLM